MSLSGEDHVFVEPLGRRPSVTVAQHIGVPPWPPASITRMRAWTVIPAATVLGLGFAVPAEAAPATVKYSLSAIGIGNADFTVQFQDGGQLREESGHAFAGYYWERTVKLDGARPILRVTPAGPPSVFRMSCHITVNDGIPVTNGLLFRAGDYTPQDC